MPRTRQRARPDTPPAPVRCPARPAEIESIHDQLRAQMGLPPLLHPSEKMRTYAVA